MRFFFSLADGTALLDTGAAFIQKARITVFVRVDAHGPPLPGAPMRATIGDSVAGNYFFFSFFPNAGHYALVSQATNYFFLGSQLMCSALYGSEEAGKIIEEHFGITWEYGPNFQSQISKMGMLATENLPLLRYCQQIKQQLLTGLIWTQRSKSNFDKFCFLPRLINLSAHCRATDAGNRCHPSVWM